MLKFTKTIFHSSSKGKSRLERGNLKAAAGANSSGKSSGAKLALP